MITNDKEFSEKLTQLIRLYYAEREVFADTDTKNEDELAKWVVTGGKILDKLNQVLADIEDYTGCGELRIILADLKERRQERAAATERT